MAVLHLDILAFGNSDSSTTTFHIRSQCKTFAKANRLRLGSSRIYALLAGWLAMPHACLSCIFQVDFIGLDGISGPPNPMPMQPHDSIRPTME